MCVLVGTFGRQLASSLATSSPSVLVAKPEGQAMVPRSSRDAEDNQGILMTGAGMPSRKGSETPGASRCPSRRRRMLTVGRLSAQQRAAGGVGSQHRPVTSVMVTSWWLASAPRSTAVMRHGHGTLNGSRHLPLNFSATRIMSYAPSPSAAMTVGWNSRLMILSSTSAIGCVLFSVTEQPVLP